MKFRVMLDKDTMEFAKNGRPRAAVLRSKRDLIAVLVCRTYGVVLVEPGTSNAPPEHCI